jgi:hypothetical protein
MAKKAKPKKPKKPKYAKKEFEKLKKWYEDQLSQKDKIIGQLKKENSLLLATALKQGAKTREIFERTRKAILKKK